MGREDIIVVARSDLAATAVTKDVDLSSKFTSSTIKEDEMSKRKHIQCMFCDKKVINIPRHLQEYHRCNKRSATAYKRLFTALEISTQNKDVNDSEVSSSQQNNEKLERYKCCPVPKCISLVLRLDTHLQRTHGFNNKSEEYKAYMQSAKESNYTSFSHRVTNVDGQQQQQIVQHTLNDHGSHGCRCRLKTGGKENRLFMRLLPGDRDRFQW